MTKNHATARSNYFRVNDFEAFDRWTDTRALSVWEKTVKGQRYFAISPDDYNNGAWPTDGSAYVAPAPAEISIARELAPYLQEGSVAVLMEIGTTEQEGLQGHAIAVDNKGKVVEIDLDEIFKLARSLGGEITRVSN